MMHSSMNRCSSKIAYMILRPTSIHTYWSGRKITTASGPLDGIHRKKDGKGWKMKCESKRMGGKERKVVFYCC